MTTEAETARRYGRVRDQMTRGDVDALVVCGSEYTGFEGAVRYMCGFRLVHRYAYVLLPLEGEPVAVFPKEARWVGNHGESFVEAREFADVPGDALKGILERAGARRVGVYGLDYVMPVRDFQALSAGGYELVRFDHEFDAARAVKSAAELESVRASMAINERGFRAVLDAYEPGRTEAELMGAAEREFAAAGSARLTMDMILSGPGGSMPPEMRHPDAGRPIEASDLLLYGLELAGPGGHWVEFSRPICGGQLSPETAAMLEAYHEYYEAARATARAGATAHELHRAIAAPFRDRDFQLGHVTGHSIGMTMIEFPRIGEGEDVELEADMVLSLHPHAIATGDQACLYMQDTWHVGVERGEPLATVPLAVFSGTEGASPTPAASPEPHL